MSDGWPYIRHSGEYDPHDGDGPSQPAATMGPGGVPTHDERWPDRFRDVSPGGLQRLMNVRNALADLERPFNSAGRKTWGHLPVSDALRIARNVQAELAQAIAAIERDAAKWGVS